MSASASVASASAEPRARGARRWLAARWQRRQRTRKPSGMHGGAARSRMASVYWHNAFCPNPSLARRAPAGQARPEASAGGHERGAVDDVQCPKRIYAVWFARGGCVARPCAKSVGRISASVSTRPGTGNQDGSSRMRARSCPLPATAIPHCPKLWSALPGAEKMRAGAGGWIVILSRNPSGRWRGGPVRRDEMKRTVSQWSPPPPP